MAQFLHAWARAARSLTWPHATTPSSTTAAHCTRDSRIHHRALGDLFSTATGPGQQSMLDLLEEQHRTSRGGVKPDISASLVVSAWTRLGLGLEDLDFASGATGLSRLTSQIYWMLVLVIGHPGGVTVLISVPQAASDRSE